MDGAGSPHLPPNNTPLMLATARPLAQPLGASATPSAALPQWMPFIMLAAGAVIVLVVALNIRRGQAAKRSSSSLGRPGVEQLPPGAQFVAEVIGRLRTAWKRSDSSHTQSRLDAPGGPRSQQASPALDPTALTDIRQLHRDLIELAQRQAVEADIRAGRLEELIAKADERIERLSRIARSLENAPSAAPSHPQPASPGATPFRPQVQVVARQQFRQPAAIGAEAAPAPIQSPQRIEPSADALQRQVCQLADEGLSSMDIAKRLGQHTGKVDLILALRR